MKINYIRDHVITPALVAIDSYSDDRADLVLVTGAAESLYQHVRQINGPARGWFQMEPRTHDDIWNNFLGHSQRQHLLDGLQELTDRPGIYYELEVNPWYAVAMCAIHYLRDPKPLPEAGARMEQATYWKRVYNTPAGRGTISEFLEKVTATIN